ncbi:MAG: LPS export ABC transporter periplasmic protein LptC [Bacteroidota bacterium]
MIRLCIAVLSLLTFFSCSNEISEALEGQGTELLPAQTTYNAVITYSNNGIVTSKLYSPRIDHYETKDSSYFLMNKGFRAEFFDSLGHFTSELKGMKGTFLEKSRIMYGEKNVTFKNLKGEHLYTDHLTWYQDSSLIVTDAPVKIVRTAGVIYGKGLEASEDFSSYSIHQITGTMYVQDDDSSFTEKDSLP